MGIQTACFAQDHWWFGCYGRPPTLLKTDDSFKLLGKYDFDCAMGICRLSENELLIGRVAGNQYHRGQVLSAKPDQTKGLAIVEVTSNEKPEATR